MVTAQELQQKLQAKLRELFQLDQPDLDFGFYRVMHAKQREISQFLDVKLPQIISEQFKDSSAAAIAEKEAAYLKAVEQAKAYGAPDPEVTEPVKKAKAAWSEAKESAGGEVAVYDHLYHFFERYYDKGDFVSLRYLTRETDHKAKPYAIPYAGEEVMLHWANADQYYVKTSENFSHFSFDAAKHPEVEKMDAGARMINNVPASLKVHFEIVDADEGDHGNIKAGKDRFFLLHAEKPCEVKDGEVTVYFEYREDPEMAGQSAKWQEKRRGEAVEALKAALPVAGLSAELVTFLFCNLETDPKAKSPRILLDVYLKRYFARNTSDYFIHKDLGGFLRRELDFYIKNDLMVLDDVAAATPESVAKWLGTLKVFRAIAEDIIAFLAQLEDFQKRLWLKKKFVVQCDYCITMDRIDSAELRAEILRNEKQLAAWKALGTDVDPKTIDMHAIDARMVDTQYFGEAFKQKLLASIDNFDEQCDGVLIHSDNFQGLRVIDGTFAQRIRCVYIDPPYNTGSDGFRYKDNYRHSSWLSMMFDRLVQAKLLMTRSSSIHVNVNDIEDYRLRSIMNMVWGGNSYVTTVVTKCSTASSFRTINPGPVDVSDRILIFANEKANYRYTAQPVVKDVDLGHFSRYVTNLEDDPQYWKFEPIKLRVLKNLGFDCQTTREGMKLAKEKLGNAADSIIKAHCMEFAVEHAEAVFETKTFQKPSSWLKEWIDRSKNDPDKVYVANRVDESPVLMMGGRQFYFLQKNVRVIDGKKQVTEPASTLWMDIDTNNLKHEGDVEFANGKKPVRLVERIVKMVDGADGDCVLDFFGGSGSTAHAVIDLNRQDNGHRKYILIEMGDHFDTVLKPRVQKVVYSPDWKDGKATAPARGVSHCFKYLRLESYEDALNNLVVDEEKGAAFAGLSDYFLKYMLDVETKGSASLMNVEEFANPFGYKLVVKKPGSEERETRVVDLVETFNYLIGLRVKQTSAVKAYTAQFERPKDEELPEDGHTKLAVKERMRLVARGEDNDEPQWKFRTVEGWIPKNRATPNDGAKERVLVVWRTLSGDLEKDNAVLDEFLKREQVNALDGEYDVIYVNGSNNVPNLKKDSDVWKVRLIEEDFRARMWEGV